MGRKAPIVSSTSKKSKRKAPIVARTRYQNVGGHIINPPEYCKYKRRFADGALWTNLSICYTMCKEQCDTYCKFIKSNTRERIQYLKNNGVYYPWKG